MSFTLGGWQQIGGGSVLADLVGQDIRAKTLTLTGSDANSNSFIFPLNSFINGTGASVSGGQPGTARWASPYWEIEPGVLCNAASGANAFLIFTAGARLKFSSGGTTDYLSSDGSATITAAGIFAATSGFIGGYLSVNTNNAPTNGLHLPAANTVEFTSNGVGRARVDSTGLLSALGTAPTFANVGGNLNTQSTPASNASTTETTLFTYDLPLNSLTTTNRGIRVTCYGSNTGSATTKTLRFYFGALLQTVVLPITNAGDWELVATIVRTGASAQRYAIRLSEENDASTTVASWTVTQGTTAQTETAAITIKVTGQDSVGAGTVTANLWSVDAI